MNVSQAITYVDKFTLYNTTTGKQYLHTQLTWLYILASYRSDNVSQKTIADWKSYQL